MSKPTGCRRLLWVDCTAGAVVGVAVLLTHGWLSEWFGLPRALLRFTGAANLAYGAYSFSLAVRSERPRALILLLIGANVLWAVLCVRWATVYGESATWLGLAHLLLEALFVGGLGVAEWRCREQLRTAL